MVGDVQALIFDFFGVLVDYDETILHRRLAPFCNDPVAALPALEDLGSDPGIVTGRTSVAELRRRLVQSVGLRMPVEDFARAWSESYSWPMPGMAELIGDLAGKLPLVLLSNIDADYWGNVYPDYEVLRPFRAVLLSFETGIAKPAPEAYRLAVEAAGCPAANCLFIDDRVRNTDAAAALGLQTHTFGGTDGLRRELAGRGLL